LPHFLRSHAVAHFAWMLWKRALAMRSSRRHPKCIQRAHEPVHLLPDDRLPYRTFSLWTPGSIDSDECPVVMELFKWSSDDIPGLILDDDAPALRRHRIPDVLVNSLATVRVDRERELVVMADLHQTRVNVLVLELQHVDADVVREFHFASNRKSEACYPDCRTRPVRQSSEAL
jgi:hypothetical protein